MAKLELTRRGLFLGATLICAPAIVRVTSLMPLRGAILPFEQPWAGRTPEERELLEWMARTHDEGREWVDRHSQLILDQARSVGDL